MPSLDIATAQPSLQNHLCTLKAQALLHGKPLTSSFTSGKGKKLDLAWKSFNISTKLGISLGACELQKDTLLIRAVATFESKRLVMKEDEQRGHNNSQMDMDSVPPTSWLPPASEDTPELEEKERLRRMRISKANKGNTPWNKGRKHSAETLQRIRERTRLAMQDPKVKMKLVNLGHAQSDETRKKIAMGVRMGWKKRQEKLLVQESCYFEWQNLIAEVSRKGYIGEEELQWDSYKILGEQLEQEWLESVEQRKTMTRPIGGKKAPKSLEQRQKIAQSIAAKWADPEYRNRVCSGLAKFHGVSGVERRPRRKPSGDGKSTRRSSTKKQTSDTDDSSTNNVTSQIQRLRLRRSNAPKYKDPLATSKLEMIKNIRAQRAAAYKKTEAINRARLFIAKAEAAAKTLEAAALKSPIAQASLLETRKLIAEAIQSIASIEKMQITSKVNGQHPLVPSTGSVNQVEKQIGGGNIGNQAGQRKVNGHQILASSSNEADFGFDKSTMQKILTGED